MARSLVVAFAGDRRIASGTTLEAALRAREVLETAPNTTVLIFDESAELVELDLRGTPDDIRSRLADVADTPAPSTDLEGQESRATGEDSASPPALHRRGRPRLGVVAREVTLLPRHWEWLNAQPGGASVALRRLVEAARKANAGKDRVRRAQEAAYRFMTAMAGDRPGYEEALRALFSANRPRFEELVDPWPPDIREHAKHLAADVFTA